MPVVSLYLCIDHPSMNSTSRYFVERIVCGGGDGNPVLAAMPWRHGSGKSADDDDYGNDPSGRVRP